MLRRGRLPTFLVIGAMKAGTTSLHQYLGAHPDVFMSEPKELAFFVSRLNWDRGLDWYRSHFRHAGRAIAVGECSPQYSMLPGFPGVPERMAGIVPDARLIYLVREPIARLQSQYLHDLARSDDNVGLIEAIRQGRGYVNTSRYGMQLDAYLDWFPREQILVVLSDDLQHHRTETIARVLDFIGVDPDVVPTNLEVEAHTTKAKGVDPARATLTEDERAALEEMLRGDVEALREWLGPDFDGWGLFRD